MSVTGEEYPDGVPKPMSDLDEEPSWDDIPGKQIDPYIDITGFEYVRGDSADITGDMQKEIFEAVLMEDKSKSEVLDIIENYYDKTCDGQYSVTYVCPGPSIKSKDKYEVPPIAARAGYFTDRFFETVNIQGGDNVYYVYVRKTGYNHQHRSLPEDTGSSSSKFIGMTEEMEPPAAESKCRNCGNEWWMNEFAKRIQLNESCPECGYSSSDSGIEDPFDVDGCYVNWEKIANKAIKDKAVKLLQHLGWEEDLQSRLTDSTGLGEF